MADSNRNGSATVARPCAKCGENCEEAFSHRLKNGRLKRQPYCRPCMVAYHRTWRATADGGKRFSEGSAASKARYPERIRARHRLREAVRLGMLTHGPCYAAGPDCRGGIEAHHDDYSKPLSVVWTCRAHHRALDRQRGAA